jgi:hypothetical protein
MEEKVKTGPTTNTVLIWGIIVAGVITFSCILSSTGMVIAFFMNAPW